MYIDAFMWKCSVCRSSDDQEVLFDQILMGQLEFPLPYWDNVSETAKVNISVCTDIVCVCCERIHMLEEIHFTQRE